jgi:hypothetical protein
MTQRIFLFVALGLLLAGGLASCKQLPWENYAQTGPDPNPKRMESPEAAAKSALEVLPQLLTAEQLKAGGFASAEELKNAELGRPLPFAVIGLDQLSREDSSLGKLLPPEPGSAGLIYPLNLGGEARYTIRVEAAGTQFQVAALGEREHLELLREATVSAQRRFGDSLASPAELRLLHLPGMNATFAAVKVGNTWWLLPDVNAPSRELGIERGQWYPAEKISPSLRRYAAILLESLKGQQLLR